MKKLSNDARRYFEAAEAWLHLGNAMEADKELEKIEINERQENPEVLALLWEIRAKMGSWEGGLETADALLTLFAH